MAHHHSHVPNTGSNSGGGWIKKPVSNWFIFLPKSEKICWRDPFDESVVQFVFPLTLKSFTKGWQRCLKVSTCLWIISKWKNSTNSNYGWIQAVKFEGKCSRGINGVVQGILRRKLWFSRVKS